MNDRHIHRFIGCTILNKVYTFHCFVGEMLIGLCFELKNNRSTNLTISSGNYHILFITSKTVLIEKGSQPQTNHSKFCYLHTGYISRVSIHFIGVRSNDRLANVKMGINRLFTLSTDVLLRSFFIANPYATEKTCTWRFKQIVSSIGELADMDFERVKYLNTRFTTPHAYKMYVNQA